MAIPVYKQKCQQRSKGQNAIAKAAYNSCSRLRLEDHDADYTKKTGLVYSALLFAEGEKKISRQAFWEKVEESENYKNATVSREGICPLPIELTRDQRLALALDFSQRMIDRYNFSAIDINIHEPKHRKREATAEENPHAHIQFPDRNRHGEKIRALSKKSELKKIRAMWGETVNAHLEKAGLDIRIDMRSLEAQLEEAEAKKAKIDRELADIETEIANIEAELKSIEGIKDGIKESEKGERNHRGDTAHATTPKDGGAARSPITPSPGLQSQGVGAGTRRVRKAPDGDENLRAADPSLSRLDRERAQSDLGSGGAAGQQGHRPNRRGDTEFKGQSLPTGEDRGDRQETHETRGAEQLFTEMRHRVKVLLERHQNAADLIYLKKILERANARDDRNHRPTVQAQSPAPHP